MSNPAVNMIGVPVVVGTRVTIQGSVEVISGSGVGQPQGTLNSTDTVTVNTTLGDSITVQAGDCEAVDRQPVNTNPRSPGGVPTDGQPTSNPARSTNGFPFSLYDQVVISGLVTVKTDGPWGINGQLTVITDFSGSSVVVSSGCVDNG